jgi:hypothetical protein
LSLKNISNKNAKKAKRSSLFNFSKLLNKNSYFKVRGILKKRKELPKKILPKCHYSIFSIFLRDNCSKRIKKSDPFDNLAYRKMGEFSVEEGIAKKLPLPRGFGEGGSHLQEYRPNK